MRKKKEKHCGHPRFHELTKLESELHNRKNADYARGGDPLGNFYRVADILDNYPKLDLGNPVVVALCYMLKQLDCALWMLNEGFEGDVEGFCERMFDVGVYAKLTQVLREETTC